MQNEPVEVTLKVTDIFAEMHLEHLQPFVSALQDEFYVDEEMIAESIQRNSSFNIIHRDTMFKVDVFIPRPFLQSQLPALKDKHFLLKRRSVQNLPAPRMSSSPNSNGIAWAAKSQIGSGAIFSAC